MGIQKEQIHKDAPLLAQLEVMSYSEARKMDEMDTGLALGSYVHDPTGEVWEVETSTVDNFQIMLAISTEGRYAIVIPGTNERGDIYDDLSISRVTYAGLPGTKWHRGFFEGAENLFDRRVVPFLRRKPSNAPVLLGGHSLGGGLAGCMAALMAEWGYGTDVEYIATWASPRYTNGPGRDFLNLTYGGRAQRFVHGFDSVPHLLPPILFKHAFELMYLGSNGVLYDCYSIKTRLREMIAAIFKRRGVNLIRDHFMVNYLSALDRITRS